MTPGPISINSSTFVGTRLAGPIGAIICTLGCILPSFVICLTLAYFYYKYRKFSGVQTVLGALRPAVVALIGSAGLSILLLALFGDSTTYQLSDIHVIELLLFLFSFLILRLGKANAVTIILGSGVIGTFLYLFR